MYPASKRSEVPQGPRRIYSEMGLQGIPEIGNHMQVTLQRLGVQHLRSRGYTPLLPLLGPQDRATMSQDGARMRPSWG